MDEKRLWMRRFGIRQKINSQLEKIEVAIKENNLNDVRFETHTKGSAANLLAKSYPKRRLI